MRESIAFEDTILSIFILEHCLVRDGELETHHALGRRTVFILVITQRTFDLSYQRLMVSLISIKSTAVNAAQSS